MQQGGEKPRKESGRGRNQDRDPRVSTKTPQMLVNKNPFQGNGRSMARVGGGNHEPSMSAALTPSMRAPLRGGANGVSCEMDWLGLTAGWWRSPYLVLQAAEGRGPQLQRKCDRGGRETTSAWISLPCLFADGRRRQEGAGNVLSQVGGR